MGAVRFQVIGKVDGVPRVVLEHITRTDPEQVPEWEKPPDGGDGCYRIKITGEPMMKVDFTHHGEHGDHNVSGMITTAQRIINALPAVVAARARHRPRHRPAAGHRPRAGEHEVSILDRFAHRPTRSRSSPAPAAASAPPPRSRSPRPGADVVISARTAEQLEGVAEQIRATGRRARRRTGRPQRPRRRRRPRADGVRRVRPARHRRQQRRRHLPATRSSTPARGSSRGVQLQRRHRARAHPRRGAAHAEERRTASRSRSSPSAR